MIRMKWKIMYAFPCEAVSYDPVHQISLT